MRKELLVNGQYYHVLNRSIAKYVIFNDSNDFLRMVELSNFYRYENLPYKYSKFSQLTIGHRKEVMKQISENGKLVEFVAFCIMPTHLHFILKQQISGGITKFMKDILDGYTRYFNIRHRRKGPLWEGHFKSLLVSSDEQLVHLTRYIHLNPVSAGLVKKPEEWSFSSYKEYTDNVKNRLCSFENVIEISRKEYKKFVLDRIAYQKELSKIKKVLFDDYLG